LIKELRKNAGFSQRRLAELMGISRSALSQIENDERRIFAEELIRLSEIFNISVDSLLGLEKQPEIVLKTGKRVRKKRTSTRINVPQKKQGKFREVLLYILNKIGSKPNIGETVIYKILYFIDFDFYERYEEQLIGVTYIKNRYGPTPVEFKDIVNKMIDDKEIEKVKSKFHQYPQNKYLPLRKANLAKLRGHEIEIIDDVLNRLSDMNAAQISDYSHNDVPWLTTMDGGTIEYEAVFYRTAPYSVRKYSEDISED